MVLSRKILSKYVVKIETPDGHGSGFIVPNPAGTKNIRCIVTAFHVIKHSYEWQEPIRIVFPFDNKRVLLSVSDRHIIPAQGRDQAVIQFSAQWIQVPDSNIAFPNEDEYYVEGVNVGWLGFPALFPSNRCFFNGVISSYLESAEAYLVDGIAINGVSGGPAFVLGKNESPIVVGLVTEYRPNLSTGTPLPGMSIVRSINPLIKYYKSEAKKYKTSELNAVKAMPTGAKDLSTKK